MYISTSKTHTQCHFNTPLLVDNTITYWMFVEQISNGESQLINNAEDTLTIKTSIFSDIPTSHST